MRRLINGAIAYALAGMAGGVFYREFTKFSGFSGQTALSVLHTHLFLLGMVVFLLAALFENRFQLSQSRKFKPFLGVYHSGVMLTAAMLLARGVLQVTAVPLNAGLDAAVSGMAGIGHILTGAGLLLLLLAIRERAAA